VSNTANVQVTPAQYQELLRFAIAARRPVYALGQPGIGKTEMSEQELSKAFGHTVTRILSLDDPVNIGGYPVPNDKDSCVDFLKARFLRSPDGGPMGILFDDLANVSPAMMAACFDLFDHPDRHLPAGSYIMAAGNRPEDNRGAARDLQPPLKRRLLTVHVVPDLADWTGNELARAIMHPIAIAYAQTYPGVIMGGAVGFEQDKPDLTSYAYHSPASLTKAGVLLKRADFPHNLRSQVLCGLLGDTHGWQLHNYVEQNAKAPSIKAIISNPTGVDVPTDIGIRFMVNHGLERVACDLNFAAIVAYAKRLPREFGQALVGAITERQPNLKTHRAMADWLTAAALAA
jgi:hypothetical protein